MTTHNSIRHYFYLLRPQQWIKNFFVFLPLVFAKKFTEPDAILASTAAFLCFCAMASSVYTLNDFLDLKADKLHPLKKLRPLAGGKVKPAIALTLGLFLGVLALIVSFQLGWRLGAVILSYAVVNIIYSIFLKRMVIVDVMCIGFFFILRVLAGAFVLGVEVSHWLLICTGLLALFLGFNKRRHELKILGSHSHEHRQVLQGYSIYFIDQMISVLTASTVIFYTLYTVDERTLNIFGTASLLYTVPFVYYGIFRYLYLVHKRGQGGDPTRLVLKDKKMILDLLLWFAVAVTVIYFKL